MYETTTGALLQQAVRWLEMPLFTHPDWLWLCVPATLAVTGIWFVNVQLGKQTVREYGEPSLVAPFSKIPSRFDRLLSLGLLNLIAICFVVAVAGPYEPVAPVKIPAGSVRLVMVIDASRSAAIEDLRSSNVLFGGPDCSQVTGPCGSRIDVAKQILLRQIMPSIDGNALGLVTFAQKGKIQSYLNYDFSPVRDMITTLDWIRVNAGLGYTSHIEEGLRAAQKVLDKTPAGAGVEDIIVLASDGGFDGRDSALTAQLNTLREKHRRLIVLGLGNALRSPIPLYDDNGASIGQFKSDGKVVTVGRDAAFLKGLAKRVGGTYIDVTPGQPLGISWPAALSGERVVYQNHTLHDRPVWVAVILLTVLLSRRFVVNAVRDWRARGRPGRSD
jgi:von Willebrand factor type A domain